MAEDANQEQQPQPDPQLQQAIDEGLHNDVIIDGQPAAPGPSSVLSSD